MAKAPRSKRQRNQRQAPRQAKPSIDTALQAASFVKAPLETGPINQTPSFQLVTVSARLWFRNYNTCIVATILPGLLVLLGGLLANGLQSGFNFWVILGLTSAFIGTIWQVLNLPTLCYLAVRVVHNHLPSVREIYSNGLRLLPRIFGLFAIVALLALGGLLLLIVPGLIVVRRYALAPYYLIDQNLGIRQAMARSAADSKPVSRYIWGVFGIYVVATALCIAIFSRILPPYGNIIGAFLTSLLLFMPALRYKEVALRQPALEPENYTQR